MKFFRDLVLPLAVGLAVFAIFHATIGSFKVYGSSMWPTIKEGEYILVNKAAYFFEQPKRGDIIVFHSPNDPKSDLIKRIIAIPGDTVEIRDKTVFINKVPLVEPYISEPPNYMYPPEEIVAARYFVLGDNRNHSADSHRGWTVPRQNIVGKAWITYWPPYRWRLIQHYTFHTCTQGAKSKETTATAVIICPMR